MNQTKNANILLEVTSNRSHGTKNRNGDIYLFGNGLKEYIGSSDLLANLKFPKAGTSIPKEKIELKAIMDIISYEQFDDLDVYIPYVKDGKLIVPKPLSERHSNAYNFRYNDCTVSGSTVWPEIIDIDGRFTRIITMLCDNEDCDKTYFIFSHWASVDINIVPVYLEYK